MIINFLIIIQGKMGKNIKIVSGLLWRFSERVSAQLVTFIVSLVLARLLEPSDYGMIALCTVFTSILNILITGGFGSALVQKLEADHLDFSSVFCFNIFFSLVLYGVIFFAAPYISEFYGNEYVQLTQVIRVMGVQVIILGVNNVQQAYVSKNMLFKKFFFSTTIGTIASAIVGLGKAFSGYGIWALVAQTLVNPLIDTSVLWITVKWRPQREFSFTRLQILIKYGWKILVSSLLNEFCNQLRGLIIGKRYSAEDLAFFSKGQQFPSIVVTNINSSIESVLFPVISNIQENIGSVKSLTRKFIKMSSYIMCPMMMGLVVVAEPLVRILLTEKWLFCVPYLRIYCFTYCLLPVQTANLQAIKAIGRSDIYLKLEIIKRFISISLLLISMKYGVLYIAISLIIESILCAIVNTFPNKKLMDYKYTELLKDIFPAVILSIVMGGILWFVPRIYTFSDIGLIVVQVVVGVVIYVGISKILNLTSYVYLEELVLSKLKRGKRR